MDEYLSGQSRSSSQGVVIMIDEEKMIRDLQKLETEIDVMDTQQKLYGCKCRICGEIGCDVLSLIHKGPVHHRCHVMELQKQEQP